MIAVELMRRSRSADATGPLGSKTPADWQEAVSNAAHPIGHRKAAVPRSLRWELPILLIEREPRIDRRDRTRANQYGRAGEVENLTTPATDRCASPMPDSRRLQARPQA
jgi:hypothetical protein